MKKAVIALSLLASLGMANTALAADELAGTAVVQWSGTVPAATTSAEGYWLVDPAGSSAYSSTVMREMLFVNDANQINLDRSTSFDFHVVKDNGLDGIFDPQVDTEATNFSVVLTNISSGPDGVVSPNSDSNGYFKILGNQEELVYNTPKAYAAGENATIEVAKAGDKVELENAVAGQIWQVVATLSVTANNV